MSDEEVWTENSIQPTYGEVGPALTISIYRDRECTDPVTTFVLVPGMDTLTVDDGCTIRFNERK